MQICDFLHQILRNRSYKPTANISPDYVAIQQTFHITDISQVDDMLRGSIWTPPYEVATLKMGCRIGLGLLLAVCYGNISNIG